MERAEILKELTGFKNTVELRSAHIDNAACKALHKGQIIALEYAIEVVRRK